MGSAALCGSPIRGIKQLTLPAIRFAFILAMFARRRIS